LIQNFDQRNKLP